MSIKLKGHVMKATLYFSEDEALEAARKAEIGPDRKTGVFRATEHIWKIVIRRKRDNVVMGYL